MKKFSGTFPTLKKISNEQIQKWSDELVNLVERTIERESKNIENYVNQLRSQNRGIDCEALAKKIIHQHALKAAGIGGLCSLGGFITIPITMPTDMYLTYRIQIRMVLAIAYIYGWNIHNSDMVTDVILVMGGKAALDVLKHIIENIGQEYTKKAISKYITREVMKKINKIVSRKIITKAGEKSLTSFARLAPIASVPIGAAYDYFTTVAIGKAAKKYYKTEKSVPPGEGGLGGRGCHLILRCSAGLGYPGIDKSNPSGDGGEDTSKATSSSFR